MEQLPKNGDFVQRRKMFVDAPFHNMQSYIPLNWKQQDHTTQQAQRARIRRALERQMVQRDYERSVEDRLQRRYINAQNRTIQNDGFRKKNPDSLSRQLQMFNKSKIIEQQNNRIKQQHQPQQYSQVPAYPVDGPGPQSPYLANNIAGDQVNAYQNQRREEGAKHQRTLQSQESFTYRPERRASLDSSRQHRTIQGQPSFVYNPQGRPSGQDHYNPPQDSRYKYQQHITSSRANSPSLLKNSAVYSNPYPQKDLGKQLEQLYTGSKPEDYPFRNVIPDKLENYLREQTKNDRKRAYQVSLNLFKK